MRGDRELPAPLLDVVLERLALPGGAAAVARPRDWGALREAEKEAGRDTPYWAVPWSSGIALARALAREDLGGRRVLELGCGLGLGSMGAARAGAAVLALDGSPDAVVFAAHNLALNELGGETALGAFSAAPAGPWDLVIAADVLYLRDNVGVLLALLPRLLGEAGEAWLADPGRAGAKDFLAGARARWHLRSEADPDRPQVTVHRLLPRSRS
jgi:predicted nicotinamide N-methyase